MNKVKSERLTHFEWTGLYDEYISLKKTGLKKDAQKKLKSFLEIFILQNDQDRRFFIDLVFRLAHQNNDLALYIPQNLYHLFKENLEAWRKSVPFDILPLKWSYNIEDLKKAVELSPNDQIVLEKLGSVILNKISMNQHELSTGFGYSGNPVADIELIDFFFQYSDNINDGGEKSFLYNSLSELRASASAVRSL